MAKELTWLFFNTGIPLVPVMIVWGISWLTNDSASQKTMFSIIKDGQLVFYCTAVTSVAIGDVRKAPSGFDTTPWIMGLLTIIIISTVAFAVAAHNPQAVREGKFGWTSVAMVIAAVLLVLNFRQQAGLL